MKFKQMFKNGQEVLVNGEKYTVKLERTEIPKDSPKFSDTNTIWEFGEDTYLHRKKE